jgi:anaerobic selenocysteine-containing dehydrogenase
MSKIVVGEMMGGLAAMPRPDYGRCKMVIYVGTNPMISHGHTAMFAVPSARLRDLTSEGEVWVLDPRRTETAGKATRHLAARPGSDYAVLGYLVRELLRDGADRDYLADHAQDVEALAAAVERFSLAHAAEISGLPEQDLADFLAAVRRAGRLCVETGTGVSMSPAANVTAWLSWALMIVTGSLDREGGAWSNPGFLSSLDRIEIPSAPPEGWRMPGPPSRPELRTVAGEFVCAALPDEIESGNLRALINLSGNLVTCMPGTERMQAALAKLEVLATIEILDNTNANIATHAFPSKDQLERPDISLALDTSYPELAASFTPAVVSTRGDVRSYWWILAQLGKRMGLDFAPGVDLDATTDEALVAQIALAGRTSIDTSGEATYVRGEERVFGWLQQRADDLGGWRLAPQELVQQLEDLQPPQSLVLISRRQLHRQNSREASGRERIAIFVNPDDARDLGLSDGDVARVRSPHGQLEGHVKIDRTMMRGTLSVPHGWEGQYNVNQLTSVDDIDPLTGMPRFSNLPVELTKVAQAASAPALEVA